MRQKLVTPYPLLDKATGGELGGDRRGAHDAGRRLRLLRISSRPAATRRRGSTATTGNGKADVTATVDIPQAKAIDPRVDGKLELVARLTGAPDDLGAEVKATLGAGRLLDRKTTGVTLDGRGEPHHRPPRRERRSLTGDIDGQPLAGSAHVAEGADGGWAIDNLGLSLASARLTGALDDRRGPPRDRRDRLQREEPRRSLAARSHKTRRRASGEDHRLGPTAAGSPPRSSPTATA